MNATGKRARLASGLNRFGAHRANHTQKSEAKRRRMGWTRSKQR